MRSYLYDLVLNKTQNGDLAMNLIATTFRNIDAYMTFTVVVSVYSVCNNSSTFVALKRAQ